MVDESKSEEIRDSKINGPHMDNMRAFASAADEILNGEDCPVEDRKFGFLFLAFDLSEVKRASYISNCTRKTMIEAMREFIARSPV